MSEIVSKNIHFRLDIWVQEIDTHDIDNTSLPGNVFRAPSEVARLQTQGTVFNIPAASTDGVDTFLLAGLRKLGVGGLAAKLELALLAVMSALGTSCRALVS